MTVGSEQVFSQALERLTEPKAAAALGSPLVSSVLYTSMEGVASATAGSGRGVDTEVLSDSLLDEIMKVVLFYNWQIHPYKSIVPSDA